MSDIPLLYSALAAHSPVLPAPVLRAALVEARRAGARTSELVALAGRTDLPQDVIDDLAKDTHPSVVAACLARPVVPGATSDRKVERRASVLAKALGGYGTPDAATFADAVECFTAKPTQALLKALWFRPASWFTPEQAAQLLRGLATHPGLDTQDSCTPALVARLGPEQAALLAQEPASAPLALRLMMHDLTLPALAGLLKNAIHHVMESRLHPDLISSYIITARQYREGVDLTDVFQDVIAYVRENYPRLEDRADSATSRPVWKLYAMSRWDLTPADPPKVTTGLEDAPSRVVIGAAAHHDPMVLEQVTTAVLTQTNAGADALAPALPVLLRNPALTVADRHRLMSLIASQRMTVPCRNAVAQVDAIDLFPTDAVVTRTWASTFPERVVAAHGWAPFGGPGGVGDILAEWDRPNRWAWPGVAPRLVLAAARAGISDADVLRVRVATLAAAIGGGGEGSDMLSDRVARVMADHLGSDEHRWATYAALAEAFTGSLGDLLATVHTISTEPAHA